MYQLFVNGIPKAQPRPRMASNGHVYNPDTADVWKEQVKAAFLSCRKPTITGPARLRVSFFLPRPKSLKAGKEKNVPHGKKPDLDNLLKAVMDAMTDVNVWRDDAQVFKTEAAKYYAETGTTGAEIYIDVGGI